MALFSYDFVRLRRSLARELEMTASVLAVTLESSAAKRVTTADRPGIDEPWGSMLSGKLRLPGSGHGTLDTALPHP